MADANLGPPGQAAGLEIASGDLAGGRRSVDAEPRRVWELAEQRAQERARADAEVEDAQGVAPTVGEQRLSAASTIVSVSGRGSSTSRDTIERQAPELALADDFRQRLAAARRAANLAS